MLLARIPVHCYKLTIHELLPFWISEGLIAVRDFPDRQILVAPRLPNPPSEFQNAQISGPLRDGCLLQHRHAAAGRVTHEGGQRGLFKDVGNDRCFTILVMEGNLPLGGLAQMIKGFDAVQITPRRQGGYLHHVAAYLRKGFCRSGPE